MIELREDHPNLETIGENNVGIHGTNVKMVDHGSLMMQRRLLEREKLALNLFTDLCIHDQ